MTCVVMQPTYFPWAGYFNLIAQADVFIFLDDVQYEKNSWQNRNRILSGGKVQWLTASAQKEHSKQLINEIQLSAVEPWRRKNHSLLQHTYGKHPFGQEVLELAQVILDEGITSLAMLNITLIRRIAAKLGLAPQFAVASELGIDGQRSERLLKFCRHFQCAEYLSPVGSAEYLAADGVFKTAPVVLRFQEFQPQPYPQRGAAQFESHLSILDVVANIGWAQAAQYVRHGKLD